jgi:hypothetical protein
VTELEREIYEALVEALEPFGGQMTEEAKSACVEAIKSILARQVPEIPIRVEFDSEANLFRWTARKW